MYDEGKAMKTLAVIGLGYVGLPLAVEFGKTYKVLGFDIFAKRILELENGYDRTLEVEEAELKNAKNLHFLKNSRKITCYIQENLQMFKLNCNFAAVIIN